MPKYMFVKGNCGFLSPGEICCCVYRQRYSRRFGNVRVRGFARPVCGHRVSRCGRVRANRRRVPVRWGMAVPVPPGPARCPADGLRIPAGPAVVVCFRGAAARERQRLDE